MKIVISSAAALMVVLFSTHAVCMDRGRTSDGRFGSKCYEWGNDTRRDICSVSFFRLIATPERYDRKLISVTGYIVKTFGAVILYPTKERYEMDIPEEGIEIVNARYDDYVESQLEEGLSPVVVVGVFDAKYDGVNIPRLGAIRDVSVVKYMPRVPER